MKYSLNLTNKFLGAREEVKSHLKQKVIKTIENAIEKAKELYLPEYKIKEWRSKVLTIIIWDEDKLIDEVDVTFKRPIFLKKTSSKAQRKYFVDDLLGLSNRQRIIVTNSASFIKTILYTYSYKKLIKMCNLTISRSFISRLLKKSKLYLRPCKIKTSSEEVIVAIDDMTMTSNNRKKKGSYYDEMGKKRKSTSAKEAVTNAVIYTSSKRIHEHNDNDQNKRKRLINRTLLSFPPNLKTKEKAAYLELCIRKIYGKKRVIVIGDGAANITKMASNLHLESRRYPDSFHFMKRIRKLLKLRINQRLNTWDIIKFTEKQFTNWLLCNRFVDKDGVVQIEKANNNGDFNYLIDRFSDWKEALGRGYISAIEGIQGNYYAELFKRKRKFSSKNRSLLISLLCAMENKWEISNKPAKGYVLHSDYSGYVHETNMHIWNMSQGTDPHGVRTAPGFTHTSDQW